MTRLLLVFVCSLVFVSATASGQMISNSTIHNDSAKESLCAARANVKPVAFFIDQKYVDDSRAVHPDTTFIAADGIIHELFECRVSQSTGRYEADAMVSEQSYWHLPRPQQFTPGIKTALGQGKAADVCLNAGRQKAKREDFYHGFSSGTDVIEITLNVTPWYRPGTTIAGMKAERYDIAVEGKLFYKSSGPDLDAVNVTCLLSPMLEVKSIQTNGREIHPITGAFTW